MASSQFRVALKKAHLLETRGFIAGQWKHATGNKVFPVYEPSTGQVLAESANFSTSDFTDAIESADRGYREFSKSTTAKDRQSVLRKWNDLILDNIDDLARILSLENGKALTEARGEIGYAASFVSWFADEAVRSYGDTIPSSFPDTSVLVFKQPVGVCGIITPWNFPAAMITRKIAPAFAAGCSVVIKPPSETPFSAAAFVKLALEAGIPSDIVNVVPTKDREASLALATHPKVKKLSFTGSTNVGKMLTRLCADTMKRVSMELGGNAPFIVFEDADLDKAVDGALASKFRASGQTCVCANRLYVHQAVLEDFTQRLIAKVRRFKLGRGTDQGTTHGPLVNVAAVEKVKTHVQDAIERGGKLRYGGKVLDREGFFFEPTVITDATKDMLLAQDETFGPVAAIFPFNSENQVVELANDSSFGLAGYFFSQDVSRVFRVAQRLECGMVGVNTGLLSAVEAPFGGIKESGVGREGSKYGLSEYQNIRSVTIGNQQS
ncbi:hypothetical protein ASPVEDRAFT_84857 [Aspergillus versicolor CBS 583.65]|uniref:Succinate-semialdehyde dehydrogenase, mitochondrial n=1 Tax=Aspergillus versicolor CBS 583.65 TaxID=1036611 RepID=A0A1L9PPG6_ASPVE|nr:uncharacterized protein ASPVEDRAFT_84857 [Aspergillus versicolor CBS 583.65]OJJ03410.1 hypothetical protein ASPVEDRAFT_84857 [Aspergillus versicolor CBS 583.65]